jgi:DNA-binding NarL/FixJ family response regulator
LNKQAAPELLVKALQKLRAGGQFISPLLRARIANEPKRRPEKTGHAALSQRELQVFELTVAGRSAKEIASELALSAKTISTFRRRTFEKLGVKNDVELLHYAREHRLLPMS